MSGPLEGVRVLEMGFWVAAPAAAAILADWGAEVTKVEPLTGDPFRGIFASALGSPIQVNPPFELDNRGKRSVALNLATEKGKSVFIDLLAKSDVFVTNLRPRALKGFGIDYESLHQRFESLVYCQIMGYGPDSADADRPSYDVGAFWARAGVAAMHASPGAPLPQLRGGVGDHIAACAAAGAIAAALYQRTATGAGQRVLTSLLRIGAYTIGWDLMLAKRLNRPIEPYGHSDPVNPLVNWFEAADGKRFWLLLLQADRHWPDLCRAIKMPELQHDERYADIGKRRRNSADLVSQLDSLFATKAMAEWAQIFDRENVWWAPVNTVNELVDDPAAEGAGAFIDVPDGNAHVRAVASPVDFGEAKAQPRRGAPELGQHTEEILLELGLDWERIAELKNQSVIP